MNFREYCHHRKAEEKLRRKPYRTLAIAIFIPLAGFIFLVLTKPVELLTTLAAVTHRIGFPDLPADIHLRAQLYEAERHVTDHLGEEPLWIELPNTHLGAFARAYSDSFDVANASLSFFPVSKSRFKACIPRRMEKQLSLESLEKTL